MKDWKLNKEDERARETSNNLAQKIYDTIEDLEKDKKIINGIEIPITALSHVIALKIFEMRGDFSHDIQQVGNISRTILAMLHEIRSKNGSHLKEISANEAKIINFPLKK
jgi:hypothetical protein